MVTFRPMRWRSPAYAIGGFSACIMLACTPDAATRANADAALPDAAPVLGAVRQPGAAVWQIRLTPDPRIPIGPAFVTNLARRYGFTVKRSYLPQRGFTAFLTDDQAELLKRDRSVVSVEKPREYRPQDVLEGALDWSLDRIDQVASPMDNQFVTIGNGRGVGTHIYIIDTGVDGAHSEFAGRILPQVSLVDDAFSGQAIDCFTPNGGHGTGVASKAAGEKYGVASRSTIQSLRIQECEDDGNGSITLEAVSEALAHVAATAPPQSVVVMSLGIDPGDPWEPFARAALASVLARGIPVVAATGNDATDDCNDFPRNVPDVVLVGGTTKDDEYIGADRAHGCVDIAAPARDVWVARPVVWGSDNAADGTSFAAPLVAGTLAVYRSKEPGANRTALEGYLQTNSVKDRLTNVPAAAPNRLLFAGVSRRLNVGVTDFDQTKNFHRTTVTLPQTSQVIRSTYYWRSSAVSGCDNQVIDITAYPLGNTRVINGTRRIGQYMATLLNYATIQAPGSCRVGDVPWLNHSAFKISLLNEVKPGTTVFDALLNEALYYKQTILPGGVTDYEGIWPGVTAGVITIFADTGRILQVPHTDVFFREADQAAGRVTPESITGFIAAGQPVQARTVMVFAGASPIAVDLETPRGTNSWSISQDPDDEFDYTWTSKSIDVGPYLRDGDSSVLTRVRTSLPQIYPWIHPPRPPQMSAALWIAHYWEVTVR